MTIYKYEIPISNYEGDEVFFKELYFEGSTCPDRNDVIHYLLVSIQKQKEEEGENYPYYGHAELEEMLETIQNIPSFPRVDGSFIHTNSFYKHPKFGRQSLSVKVIDPIPMWITE